MKRLLVIAALCFLLTACASAPTKKQGPGELYVEGVNLMKAKQYDKAVQKFNGVIEDYPFDPLALVAAVKLGDAHFEKKDHVIAASVYDSFVGAHPEDENAPYVLFRLGECYEKLSLSVDRDQANTLKAMEKYTFLKNRYPRTNYAGQVDEKLKHLEQKLADRELYVGEFYYRTSQYNAAIVRLEYFLKKYPNASGTDKAYFYISSSYKELANPEKADYYMEKLKAQFPRSVYARATIREKKTLKLANAQPAGSQGIKRKRLNPVAEPESAKTDEPAQTAKPEEIDRPTQPGEPTAQQPDSQTASGSSRTDEPVIASQPPTPAIAEPGAFDAELIRHDPSGSDHVEPPQPGPQMAKLDRTRPAEEVQDKKPGDTILLTPKMYQEEIPKPVTDKKKVSPEETKEAEKPKSDEKDKKKDLDFFDKSKPVDIVSDSMEGFDKEKYVVFRGNVIAKQEDLYIFADIIEAHLNDTSNEIERAYARQNVKIVKKERTATSSEAIFDNKKGEIILKGNVVVYQGHDRLSGEVVTYYVNEDRAVIEAEVGKRAHVILTPNK
ncbi:MAG: outer membrane protein assembly factor BamD [Syntrophobacterales bacterium]|jgi:outer membrane protein assembly factor BamD|nr:outer membrane protein assembly factor BamD [Syntrophobacterales bacterium]